VGSIGFPEVRSVYPTALQPQELEEEKRKKERERNEVGYLGE
jgi:hypothetical protein